MHGMASASATHLIILATAAGSGAPPACSSTLSKSIKGTTTSRPCHGHRRRRALSCRASGDRANDGILWLPRRDVLAGLTGVAAGLAAYPDLTAGAADEFETCRRADKVTDQLLACKTGGGPCPPKSPTIIDFSKLPKPGTMRKRQPAHLMDASSVEKYNLALTEMKKLDPSDPRSFDQQAAIHEAYCDGHYRFDPTEKDAPFDVHFSWVFAPWHRMYIYFYERILGSLINEDTFALPYWNWDAPAGMVLPAMFKDSSSPLYDANRNPNHLDAYVNLHFNQGDPAVPFDLKAVEAREYNEVVKKNLCTVYHQMVRNGRGARCFHGDKFCTTYKASRASGTSGSLERCAHTAVHKWTGKPDSYADGHDGQKHKNADMGFLGSAARDPVFYSHHANVDRMWHLWSTQLGHRDFDNPEWLDTSFVFYDEEPKLVRIRICDVLDTAALGYTFEEKEPLLWRDSKPTLLRPKAAAARRVRRSTTTASPVFPVTLKKGQSVEVPFVPLPRKQKGKLEVLVIDGIEFDACQGAKFDVAINQPVDQAKDVGPQYSEYAGSFVSLPRGGDKASELLQVKLSLPLDEVLADIGVGDGDNAVSVVLVLRTEDEIKINRPLKIETQDS